LRFQKPKARHQYSSRPSGEMYSCEDNGRDDQYKSTWEVCFNFYWSFKWIGRSGKVNGYSKELKNRSTIEERKGGLGGKPKTNNKKEALVLRLREEGCSYRSIKKKQDLHYQKSKESLLSNIW